MAARLVVHNVALAAAAEARFCTVALGRPWRIVGRRKHGALHGSAASALRVGSKSWSCNDEGQGEGQNRGLEHVPWLASGTVCNVATDAESI